MSAADRVTTLITIPCRDNRSFAFSLDRAALLVVDMQRDFLKTSDPAATGSPDPNPLASIMPTVASVLSLTRTAGLSVIHTREGYRADGSDVNAFKRALGYVGKPGPNGSYLIRGTRGHDFMDGFEPAGTELVIDKAGFSAFYRTDLDRILGDRGVTHLVIAGVTTQCCVHSTLRDAVEHGYFCLTLEDCCAAVDPAVHEATLQIIRAENHLFGWVSDSAAFVDAIKTGLSRSRI